MFIKEKMNYVPKEAKKKSVYKKKRKMAQEFHRCKEAKSHLQHPNNTVQYLRLKVSTTNSTEVHQHQKPVT